MSTKLLDESVTSLPAKVRRKATSSQGAFFIQRQKKYITLLSRSERMQIRPTYHEKLLIDRFSRENIKFAHQRVLAPYIVDFLLKGGLILEIDSRAHDRQLEYDLVRDSYLMRFGFIVKRVYNEEVEFEMEKLISDLKIYFKSLGFKRKKKSSNKRKTKRLNKHWKTGKTGRYIF